jgi:hypothetical protein
MYHTDANILAILHTPEFEVMRILYYPQERCGASLDQPTTARPRRFCSDACRQQPDRQRHTRRAI